MQEVEYNDGRRLREFFDADLKHKLLEKYNEAMAGGEVKSIRQMSIGRNDPCPCGSGKKFKRCCIAKVNKGPEQGG